jgi:hypothetical protein
MSERWFLQEDLLSALDGDFCRDAAGHWEMRLFGCREIGEATERSPSTGPRV